MPDIVAVLRASTSDFTAKMQAARAEMAATESEGSSNFSKLATASKGALLGVGAAVVGVGVAAVDFGDKLEASQASLEASLRAAGISWDGVKNSVSQAGQAATRFGFTQAQVDAALSLGIISTQNYASAHRNLQIAIQLAAARHIDLSQAMTIVDKAAIGQTRALKQMGIDLAIPATNADKLKKAQDAVAASTAALNLFLVAHGGAVAEGSKNYPAYLALLGKAKAAHEALTEQQNAGNQILDALSRRLGGQASAAADTFAGRVAAMKAQGENLAAQIGLRLIPMLESLVSGIEDAVKWFQQHKAVAEALAITIGTVLAGAIVTFTVNAVGGMIASVRTALTTLGLMSAEQDTTQASTDALTAAMTRLEAQMAALAAPEEAAATAQEAVNVAWAAAEGLATTLDADLTVLAGAYERLGIAAQGAGAETTVAGGEMAAAGSEAGAGGLAGGLEAGGAAAGGLTGVLGPLGLAVGGVTLGAVALNHVLINQTGPAFVDATNKANAMAQATLPELTLKLAAAKGAQEQAAKAMHDGGFTALEAAANHKVLTEGIHALQTEQTQLTNNLNILTATMGLNKSQASSLAQSLGIDLGHALTRPEVTALKQQLDATGQSMDAAGGKAQTMSTNAIAALSQMSVAAQQTLSSSEWTSLGEGMASGVAAGINAAAGAAAQAAAAMAANALAAAKSAIASHSPSRKFADEVGATIPQGVAAGIEEQAHLVNTAVSSMMSGAGTPGLLAPSPADLAAAGGSSVPVGGGQNAGATVQIVLDNQVIGQALFPSIWAAMLQNKRYTGTLNLS